MIYKARKDVVQHESQDFVFPLFFFNSAWTVLAKLFLVFSNNSPGPLKYNPSSSLNLGCLSFCSVELSPQCFSNVEIWTLGRPIHACVMILGFGPNVFTFGFPVSVILYSLFDLNRFWVDLKLHLFGLCVFSYSVLIVIVCSYSRFFCV